MLTTFNGENYSKTGKSRYWYKTKWGDREALHRAVWRYHNGGIPDGFHVHHIDHDPDNNDITNLVLMSSFDHLSYHGQAQEREGFPIEAQVAAAEWHRSQDGREWHHRHGIESWENRTASELVCEQCGDTYETRHGGTNKFCSAACRSAARRASGVDDELRRCEICEERFTANKYSNARCCSATCAARLRKFRRVT